MKKHFLFLVMSVVLLQQNIVKAPAIATWDVSGAQFLVSTTNVSTVKRIYGELGMVPAEALLTIYNGAHNAAIRLYGTAKGANFFLTTKWLGYCATSITDGTTEYYNMKPVSKDGLSEINKNYLMHHLAPALKALNSAIVPNVDPVGKTSSLSFNPRSFNGVIITTINNNTQEKFNMYQNVNNQFIQIGSIKPGINDVALYGAAHEQGDIIFIPKTNEKGSFRVSFKTGPEVVTIANTPTQKYSTSHPVHGATSGDEFLCVQVTKHDFPSGTNSKTIQGLKRTQCVRLTDLKGPAHITLNIEDSIDFFSNFPMYFPSISSVADYSVTTTQKVPFLLLPKSLSSSTSANNIVAWIDFLNIVVQAVADDYSFYTPVYITPVINKVKNIAYLVIRKEGEDFGDLSNPTTMKYHISGYGKMPFINSAGKKIKTVTCGLPSTNYVATSDIPSLSVLKLYLGLQVKTFSNATKTITTNISDAISLENVLKTAKKNPTSVQNMWKNLVSKYKITVSSSSAKGDTSSQQSFTVSGDTQTDFTSFVHALKDSFLQKVLLRAGVLSIKEKTENKFIYFDAKKLVTSITSATEGTSGVTLSSFSISDVAPKEKFVFIVTNTMKPDHANINANNEQGAMIKQWVLRQGFGMQQHVSKKISTFLSAVTDSEQWKKGFYFVPYYKWTKKSSKHNAGDIVSDITKISSADPAEAWVAIFDLNKNLLITDVVSNNDSSNHLINLVTEGIYSHTMGIQGGPNTTIKSNVKDGFILNPSQATIKQHASKIKKDKAFLKAITYNKPSAPVYLNTLGSETVKFISINVNNATNKEIKQWTLLKKPGSPSWLQSVVSTKISNKLAAFTSEDWNKGIYIVPYYTTIKQKVATDLTKFSLINPGTAWVAIFNSKGELLVSDVVSQVFNGSNLLKSHTTEGVYNQVMNIYGSEAVATIGTHYSGFAISSSSTNVHQLAGVETANVVKKATKPYTFGKPFVPVYLSTLGLETVEYMNINVNNASNIKIKQFTLFNKDIAEAKHSSQPGFVGIATHVTENVIKQLQLNKVKPLLQPIVSAKISNYLNGMTNQQWKNGVYVVPYYTTIKQKVATDLTKFSLINPGIAWVAIFDSNGELLVNDIVSQIFNGSNPLRSHMGEGVYSQVVDMTGGFPAPLPLDAHHGGFAISSVSSKTSKLVAQVA